MKPDLSVCVVSYNTRDLLQTCLDALFATLSSGGPRAQVWVVDNGSSDGSAQLVRGHYPAARLIECGDNLGFARASNRCLARSEGRYVLLLNSDAIVQTGAVRQLFEFMENHPRAGLVGPQLLDLGGSPQPSSFAFPTWWSELLGYQVGLVRPARRRRSPRLSRASLGLPGGERAYEVGWLNGACLLVRRRAVDEVGLLDPHYFMYSEETDWCLRMQQAGWRRYFLPAARVIHLGGGSTGQGNLPLLLHLYRSKLYYFRKHHGPLQASTLRLGLVARFGLRAALEGLRYVATAGRYADGPRLLRQRLDLARETARIRIERIGLEVV